MNKLSKKLSNYLKLFKQEGFCELKNFFDKSECDHLYNRIKKNRKWNKNLFLNKKNFLINPQMKKTNPGKNIFNLVNKYNLDFIEKNKTINSILNQILGENYELMLSKFVVAVPQKWMPKYVKNINKKKLVSNFGPYIKKKYRDVTYFRGLEYHMDSVDWKNQSNKFVTMYVYLNDTNLSMSPLNVIKKSHILGHTSFPHFIKAHKNNKFIKYSSNNKKFFNFKIKTLIGGCGSVYFWTSNTLHGTRPAKSEKENFRISLRYLFKKKSRKTTLIDKIIKNQYVGIARKKIKSYKKILV